ncbi:uncharacterized protein OCT59_003766 [Rhizophagus irregularis]|uniref:uncharacterized protein n=1 Tax=Rhizophagus irregularis TaxID=588596 RepID=UPI0033292C82|nr:hypothetical protein OCT59_003766 [Rhizophagus irregularis]
MSSIDNFSDIEEFAAEDFDQDKSKVNNNESESEENEEVFAFFTQKLQVRKVIHTTTPVEYPETSPNGVATIYNITGWKNHMDAFSDIQYSTNGASGSANIKECPFFGGISVKKDTRKCQGIKYCQFSNPEIINQEHCSVDFDSETFQNYTKQQNNNSKEAKTYSLFLAAKESSCPFKKDNNVSCDGKARLGKIANYQQTETTKYFIGCDKYKQNEKWHRFINIKPEETNISLLQQLFSGTASIQELSQCSMIIPRSCKRKKCDMPHTDNGAVVRGEIIERSCSVQFIKIIPHDITKCPFVALICIGVHNHPPPPPERTPSGIKNNLQILIEQAINQDDTTTSRSILSGNLIKAYFNKEILAEIHVSLNNIDKLRYLVGKAYKTLHPFGQGVMGVYHYVSNKDSDLIDYVHKIDLFTNNGQVIIICMLPEQAKKLITLEWFQIDVSFKRVKGEINEFEINTYDSNYHLILSFCRHIHKEGVGCILADLDAAQAKGLGLALYDLDCKRNWETHLTFIFKSCIIHFQRNLHNKAFNVNTKNLIKQIPSAPSKEAVYDLLQQIRDTNDNGIKEWVDYYQQSYVLASLNQFISNIDPEIWLKSGSNTNYAEAAHSMVNREGKQLSLLSAILRGKRFDERCYKTIDICNKSGVPYTHRDRSEIKRTQESITRKASHNQKSKESVIDLTNDELPTKSSLKRSSVNRNKSLKKSKQEKSEEISTMNEISQLEIEERKMALRERAAEVRKKETEAEALEIANSQRKKENESFI